MGKIINEVGIPVVALHISLESLNENINHVVEQARRFDTDKVVITGMRHFQYSSKESLQELCRKLDYYGKKLSDNHIQLLYHNHNCEFIRLSDGQIAFDYIVQHTDERYLNFELDIYWVCDAGVGIVSLMEKLGSRMKLLHINDRCYTPKNRTRSIVKFHGCEVGSGTLNVKQIIEHANRFGLENIIIETHDHWINNNPVKSFILSIDYLSKI